MKTRPIFAVNVFTILLLCFAPNTVVADLTGFNGSGGIIPDAGSAVERTITISASQVITGVSFSINDLSHLHMGDLVVSVRHEPSGNMATLFDQVGPGANGDDSNFAGTYFFGDSGGDLWSEAASKSSNQNVTPGTYFATDAANLTVNLDATFAGGDSAGDWIIRLQDVGAGEEGSFGGWSLRLSTNAVPEPISGLAILPILGFVALRRRRK